MQPVKHPTLLAFTRVLLAILASLALALAAGSTLPHVTAGLTTLAGTLAFHALAAHANAHLPPIPSA